MPARPRRVVEGDRYCTIAVRLPAGLRNLVVGAALDAGLSLNAWGALAFRRLLEEGGVVVPGVAGVAPVPSVEDEVRGVVLGERLLGPCGRGWPCGLVDGGVEDWGGVEFCCECGVRVG